MTCLIVFFSHIIVIIKLPSNSSHGWLTFLKHCHWFVGQEYNRHAMMKVLISAKT